MSNQLHIRTFGGILLTNDTSAVTGLASRKAAALMVYLAANPRPHPRETLATMLWDDRTTTRALGNLSVVLSSLRKRLGDYVEISRQTVTIHPDANVWLDAAEFAKRISAVGDHVSGKELNANQARQIEAALDWYQGDFLEGFFLRDATGYEEWAALEQDRLRQLAGKGLRLVATFHQQRHETTPAIRYASRLVALDPLSESAHTLLMKLYAHDGQRSAALAQYETCKQLLLDELGVEPDTNTTALYEQILQGDVDTAARAVVSAEIVRPEFECPAETTPFFGREAELDHIDRLIADPNCRLLTITGPGGVGKSRLALHVAHRLAQQFSHGAAFVSLATIDTPSLIPNAIGDALKLTFSAVSDPIIQLSDYLRQKEVLLVLDNVEHLSDGAPMLQALLEAAPNLMVVATSRERLQLKTEWLLPLVGLPFPEADAQADTHFPAVVLFEQSARRVRADFELSGQVSAVAQICRLVEGLPLGVELAASWVRVLSCDEIAQEMTKSLTFLSSNMRDVAPRHRSLQAVFDHSWALLDSAEKTALARLAIFRGGFSRSAAEQVTGLSLVTLTALTDKSLVRLYTPQRYQMHALLREFCQAKLTEDDAARASAEQNHATYFITFLADRLSGLIGGKQQASLAKIRDEMGNLQQAWDWVLANWDEATVQSLPLWDAIHALFQFFTMQSHFQEGADWFKKMVVRLRTSAEAELYPHVLARLGWLMYLNGEPEAGEQYLITAETLFEDASDPDGCQFAITYLGVIAFYRGDLDVAMELVTQAWTVARALQNPIGETIALNVLGMIHYKLGLFEEAETLLRDCLRIKKQLGDRFGMSFSLGYLGNVAVAQKEYATAHRFLRQSLELRRELGDRRGEALCLADLAELDMRQQQPEAAKTHWLQAAAIWHDLGNDSAERATRSRAAQVTG